MKPNLNCACDHGSCTGPSSSWRSETSRRSSSPGTRKRKRKIKLQSAAVLVCSFVLLWLPRAFSFSSDASSLTRNFTRSVARTNSGIAVTATFTNGTAQAMRGFYFADQLPSALAVTTVSVTLNGLSVTNYVFESGMDGDVYAGCTPWRWVLEQPAGFIQTNPVPPGGWVQIIYSATALATGTFSLAEFEWAGFSDTTTNASFGYSEAADQQSLSFVSNGPPAFISGLATNNGWALQLDSLAGCSYVLQASTDLFDWSPLVTNTTPFGFTDTNAPSFPARFYRGLWVP
jgi:hypothetical protein